MPLHLRVCFCCDPIQKDGYLVLFALVPRGRPASIPRGIGQFAQRVAPDVHPPAHPSPKGCDPWPHRPPGWSPARPCWSARNCGCGPESAGIVRSRAPSIPRWEALLWWAQTRLEFVCERPGPQGGAVVLHPPAGLARKQDTGFRSSTVGRRSPENHPCHTGCRYPLQSVRTRAARCLW